MKDVANASISGWKSSRVQTSRKISGSNFTSLRFLNRGMRDNIFGYSCSIGNIFEEGVMRDVSLAFDFVLATGLTLDLGFEEAYG